MSDLSLVLQLLIHVHAYCICIQEWGWTRILLIHLCRWTASDSTRRTEFRTRRGLEVVATYINSFWFVESEVIHTYHLKVTDCLPTHCHTSFLDKTDTIIKLYIVSFSSQHKITFFDYFLVFTVPLTEDGLHTIAEDSNGAEILPLTVFGLTDLSGSGDLILDRVNINHPDLFPPKPHASVSTSGYFRFLWGPETYSRSAFHYFRQTDSPP